MRWHDVLLGAMAVLTAALVALTFRAVGQTPDQPGGEDGTDGEVFLRSSDATARSSAPPDAAAATTSAPRSDASRITSVRRLLQSADPLVVAALGDSTGNESWEWTFEWARMLAESRPVTVLAWNGVAGAGYAEPLVLSEVPQPEGPGPITMYVGHQDGARAAYPAQHLAELVPEEPDLVILNYGHNNSIGDIEVELDQTLTALRDTFGDELPVILTLQQPQLDDANAEVREAVHDFAADHALGWIDVAAAFAERDGEVLMLDGVHPNEAGQRVWATKVATVLRAP